MSSESVYWLYSTGAQVLAAVLGLLLAGYALMFAMMDARTEDDETLEEISEYLQRGFFYQMVALTVVSIITVSLDASLIYLNTSNNPVVGWLQLPAILFMGLALVQITVFIISTANPRKYEKAAKRLLKASGLAESGPDDVPTKEFAQAYDQSMAYLRDVWDLIGGDREFDMEGLGRRERTLERITILTGKGILSEEVLAELKDLMRARNLIFHVRQPWVPAKEMERVRRLEVQLKILLAEQTALQDS